MPTKTVADTEYQWLCQILGVTGVGKTLSDLRNDYYTGVANGTIVLGGSSGPETILDAGTANGVGGYYYSIPGTGVSGRVDTSVVTEHNTYTVFGMAVPKKIRIRRIAQDSYAVTGTPTGAGSRHAIYNRLSHIEIGTLVADLNSASPFAIGAAFAAKTVDVTLNPGHYFVVSHHDYGGVSAVSQRRYTTLNGLSMAGEQSSPILQGVAAAWPGSWNADGAFLVSGAPNTGLSGGPVPSTIPLLSSASVLFGWDNA